MTKHSTDSGLDSKSHVTVAGLSFRYPGAAADTLKDVSFSVHEGHVLGVLGPNGSGKSTLLGALLGVRVGERRGTVTVRAHGSDSRREVGFAAQQVALYHLLTVRENLRHVARTLVPRPSVASAVDDAISEHGLGTVADTQVYRLSGGWQRLAHLAASFVHRPRIRLLDEPTAALDFEARSRLVELIKQWRRQGILMLVTSHYPEDIDEICTHALLVENGTVARHGTLAELLSRHQRELMIEVNVKGRAVVARGAAPATPSDVRRALDDILAESAELAAAELMTIRLTDNKLRDVLAADPRLRGLLDDGA